METILNYLNNMFLNLPETEEVKKAKAELTTMMEDKYNELIREGKKENEAIGIVISEFGNFEELAGELGLSNEVFSEHTTENEIFLDGSTAKEYMEASKKQSFWIAWGVMFIIFSPIPLLVLGGIQEEYQRLTDGELIMAGLIPLLLIVTIAVAILIYHGIKGEKYEYLQKKQFSLDKSFEREVKEERENFRQPFAIKIVLGVSLCIIGVIPIVFVGAFSEENALYAGVAVAVLLFLVGIAVWLFVTAGMREESYKIILQESEYSVQGKKNEKLISKIGGIYWPVVVIIYLAWSFITSDWGFTWIVWPIAGIMFGIIATICSIVQEKRE